MMRVMYLATGDALAVVQWRNGAASVDLQLRDNETQCVAVDPARPERVFCGTFGQGLWHSEDGGRSWHESNEGMSQPQVMAVAVSRSEPDVVWAGTEPSALFRSDDSGRTWRECPGLLEVPSQPTWSFPPRPWTSHVRWIAPDPIVAGRLFVGIELGGVMKSTDGGATWEDRKPGSQYDAHTLRTHPLADGRIYEAAGGGYAESLDAGRSWRRFDDGLTRRYVWGLAVDPGNPDVMLVSAAPGPREAHNAQFGDAGIYRRSGDSPWQEVREGLPSSTGQRTYVLATNDAEPGVFYAAGRDGTIYRSADGGSSWENMMIVWPEGYVAPDVRGFEVVEL